MTNSWYYREMGSRDKKGNLKMNRRRIDRRDDLMNISKVMIITSGNEWTENQTPSRMFSDDSISHGEGIRIV